MRIATISSKKLADAGEGTVKNNYLYNDKELFDDGDLNWYDYGFRNYDPQIGRFTQLDPLTFEYPFYTPYQFAGDDPIANVDRDGLEPAPVVNFALKVGGKATLIQAGKYIGKWTVHFFKDGISYSKVFTHTGQLMKKLLVATEMLGLATRTLAVTGKILQQSHVLGDLNSSFRIPNQFQSSLSNYDQALNSVNSDWHPIDPELKIKYGYPEGGKINWSTGQIVGASTSIEMVDGPETWLPWLLSGGVAKLAGRGLEEGAEIEMHHLLPQAKKFQKFFERAGLDVEDYKIPLDKATHRLKPYGIHTIEGGNWNKQWKDFFAPYERAGTFPSKNEILGRLKKLRKGFGI